MGLGVPFYSWLRAPAPAPASSLRVATWNLRNFPAAGQNVPAMREQLERLDAAILAVQEVIEPGALRELAPGYEAVVSAGGGRHGQRVGVLYDPARVTFRGSEEIQAVALTDALRPALAVEFAEVTVIVVHLKALRAGLPTRRAQWEALAPALERRAPLVVLGDFNATGGPAGPDAELAELRARMLPVGLRLVPTPGGCSSYWDGPRRDAWLEPSRLDLVWIGVELDAVGTVHGPCARHACRPYRGRSGDSPSDHCPVAVDLSQITDTSAFDP